MSRASILPLLFIALHLACIDGQYLSFDHSGSPAFVVTLDEEGRLVGAPEGPFRGDMALETTRALASDHRLLVLTMDEDLIRARYPAYAPGSEAELSLVVAPTDLETCAEHGFLEEERRLLVPLEALKEAITVTSLAGPVDSNTLPSGLALRFEARVCNRGPRMVLRPFAETARVFGPTSYPIGVFQDFAVIDDDRIVVFADEGVAFVRRSQPVDPARDLLRIADVMQAPTSSTKWMVKSGDLAPGSSGDGARQLVLGLTLFESAVTPDGNPEVGGAVLELRLHPDGRFEAGTPQVLSLFEQDQRATVSHLRFEPDGRYAAVGFHAFVAGASASAEARVEQTPGFAGRAFIRLMASQAPHLVVGSSSQVFEGDLFAEFDRSRVQQVNGTGDRPLNAVTQLQDRPSSVVAVGGGGVSLIRGPTLDWTPYSLQVPNEALSCASPVTVCGRRTAVLELSRVLAVSGGGVLVGSFQCSGLYWRSALDPCASVVSLQEDEIEFKPGAGVSMIREHLGRIYVAAEPSVFYEVELIDDPT